MTSFAASAVNVLITNCGGVPVNAPVPVTPVTRPVDTSTLLLLSVLLVE